MNIHIIAMIVHALYGGFVTVMILQGHTLAAIIGVGFLTFNSFMMLWRNRK